MKKLIYIFAFIVLAIPHINADDLGVTDVKYNRSSIYSVMVSHAEQDLAGEIKDQFLSIPVPDQYNDHDLSVKIVSVNSKGNYDDEIERFINKNHIVTMPTPLAIIDYIATFYIT